VEARAWEWLDELGRITDEPPGLTRTFLSPALERAKDRAAGWMRECGLAVFEDQVGNLIGRLASPDPDAPTVACGSHLDTVRNAGRFDGALGIVLAILAADRLARRGHALPFHLEVVGFSDEEGVRFQTTYLGSRHYCGRMNDAALGCTDENGISVHEAIAAHRPRFPLPPPRRLAGYIEAHIEQGPVLEAKNLALGVATAIAGQTRARVIVDGRSGHAGTTPMPLRHDALAGAAECVLAIERFARESKRIVATVGDLRVRDGAGNVIPGHVEFTIDIRDAEDAMRERFCDDLFAHIGSILEARGLRSRIEIPLVAPAAACAPRLSERLAASVARHQGSCPLLVSGAGHDAVAMSEVTDVALLFVRCRAGLSHHPDEYASPEDIDAALEVLTEFLADFPA